MDQILLSISMLASNRKDTVRRCLNSLKPIMEQIPSELILVDTSTDPEVPPILAEYTDKIIKFQWCNDFSKARNVGLEAAKGEWFLYIDDDEWFVEIDELISFFKSGEYKKYGCANYIQRNFHDLDLVNYSDIWVSRMIQLDKDTHFRSKIHEYLYPVRGNCKMLKLVANHTGYIAVTEEDRMKRYNRNSVLLLEMIEEEPERLRWRVQLAQEYWSVQKWDKLLDFCMENLEYTKNLKNEDDCRDIGTFYAGAMESMVFFKKYKEAKALADQVFCDQRISELCQAYIRLRLATIALREENWLEAQAQAQTYLEIERELKKREVRYANQKGALIVDETFETVPNKRTYSILIACGLKKKDTSWLKKYLSALEWNQKVIYVFMDLVPILIEAMATLPYEEIFVEALQYLWNNAEIRNNLFVMIQSWEIKDKTAFRRLLYVVAKLEGQHWYLWYAKILVAGLDHEYEGLEEKFTGYFQNTPDIFATPENITEIAKKAGISIEREYMKIPFERWNQHLRQYIAKVGKQDLLLLERDFLVFKTENIRFDYLFLRCAEAKVLYSKLDQDYEKKEAALREFAEASISFIEKYYKKDIIKYYPELLPAHGQAALMIREALQLKEENPKAMLEKICQVVEIYETFADAVKSFVVAYGDEQDRIQKVRKEELKKLERQVMEEIKNCIDRKDYEQAIQIVNQLKKMKPNNLELVQLSLEIRLAMLE